MFSSLSPAFPEDCDWTSGCLGLWLILLGLLNKNYMQIQCSFLFPRYFSSFFFPFQRGRFGNPEILTLSYSPVHVFTAFAGSGIGTLRRQKKGPRFQNYLSSGYKCPQMQPVLLRHLLPREILLASSVLPLQRKSSCSPNPSLPQVRAS